MVFFRAQDLRSHHLLFYVMYKRKEKKKNEKKKMRITRQLRCSLVTCQPVV